MIQKKTHCIELSIYLTPLLNHERAAMECDIIVTGGLQCRFLIPSAE